ncbi:IclR family transcriptional regulator [Microbacterium sp. KRD172]|uniref:IclR family transcriptional regulator n=1 Tax=Microbacterium sp. KRD172 TaxID=2729727 RepID=UPI0019D14FB1|nr:IclR family transcriptional regulator [Microbacterium sp. KRD172]
MTPTERGSRRNTSGLGRDIEILELLGSDEAVAGGGLGVMRIAQLTGRDKAVISRTMATLSDAELVERDPSTMNFRLGSRLFAIAARTTEATLVSRARAHLRNIAQSTRETTHLCVLRGGNVLTVLSELSPHEFRTTGWEGVTTAAWRTPSGRVLISDWDRKSLTRWYEEHGRDEPLVGPLNPAMAAAGFAVLETPPENKAIVRDLDSLFAELQRIRERGYATLDEELELDVVGASAPITDFTGRIIAAINVSAPKSRIGGQLDRLGAYVAQAASELSASLGAPQPPLRQ